MHDIIGDIHGHCEELEVLLDALGYQEIEDSWVHPEGRKVIFVGDYIDRGPQILETVRL
ncbi:MAG: metallophosphoesterase, partial [Cyclobacteriaceae bacterium]